MKLASRNRVGGVAVNAFPLSKIVTFLGKGGSVTMKLPRQTPWRDPQIATGCPPQLYLAGCWVPQPRDERQHQLPLGFPNKMGCQDHGAEPTHSFMWPQVGCLLACQELPQYQHFHPPEHWWWCNLLPHPKVLLTLQLARECWSPHD